MLPEPYNNNYRIEQSPGYVTILVEMNHDTRIIPVDGRAPLSPKIAQWVGDSRGHWDGDTLVVETRNLKFNHQSRFGVGYLNGASDENLRVVERFTRTDANTLTYRATVEDPTVFTRPWTVEIPMDRPTAPSTRWPATRATTGCSTSCRATGPRNAPPPARANMTPRGSWTLVVSHQLELLVACVVALVGGIALAGQQATAPAAPAHSMVFDTFTPGPCSADRRPARRLQSRARWCACGWPPSPAAWRVHGRLRSCPILAPPCWSRRWPAACASFATASWIRSRSPAGTASRCRRSRCSRWRCTRSSRRTSSSICPIRRARPSAARWRWRGPGSTAPSCPTSKRSSSPTPGARAPRPAAPSSGPTACCT